jgi:hypothetical protein
LDGIVVDKEACLKIISAIEDQIEAGEQLGGIARVQVFDKTLNGDAAIDATQFALGGDGFGQGLTRVVLVEKRLALQIGGLDKVAIENPGAANSSANEQASSSRADGSAANDNDARCEQALLTFFADSSEEHLTRVLSLKRIEQAQTRCGGER